MQRARELACIIAPVVSQSGLNPLFSGDRIVRLIVFLLVTCGFLFVGSVLFFVAGDRLPTEFQRHAAAVIFISCAFLGPAVALAVLNHRLPLAALLAGTVLAVDLAFYLKTVRGVSFALSPDCPFGLCLVRASSAHREIFGFAEFVTALALLVIVYTVTDVRYRFRLLVAPIPLYRLTYVLLAIIGFGTLLIDVWFNERWFLPLIVSDQSLWQAAFGLLFFLVAMAWLWFAFIRPPVFGRRNAFRFTRTLYRYILRGWDTDLPTIADELVRSARPIVSLSKQQDRWENPENEPADDSDNEQPVEKPDASDYAYDLLLLLGNRKFCRSVASSSPVTAIAFFQEAVAADKLHVPLGTFGSNVVTEALLNQDSILYHEDAGYHSGLIGYIRPFGKAVFGDFRLVQALGSDGQSPLDVSLDLQFSWDARQLEAYCRCALITIESYLETRLWYTGSFILYRTFDIIEGSCLDIYKLNNETAFHNDSFRRLRVVVDFAKDVVKRAQQHIDVLPIVLRRTKQRRWPPDDFLDHIAKLMFDVIFHASAVREPEDTNWEVQHNAVWADFELAEDTRAQKIVRFFKLHRLLFDEIRRLETMPNYKSARILGFCLNVLGLKVGKKTEYGSEECPLRKAVLNWTRKNYLKLVNVQPEVAAAVPTGRITFDAENNRLVKTYFKGLQLEAPKEYLALEQPSAG